MAKIHELGFVFIPHPLYSPDLAQCDFFLFHNLKTLLGVDLKEYYMLRNKKELKKCSTYFFTKLIKQTWHILISSSEKGEIEKVKMIKIHKSKKCIYKK